MMARNPAPWQFDQHRFGLSNVVVDAHGSVIVQQVPANCGPLIAAAPSLLRDLARIAEVAPAGSEARAIAEAAVEAFTEREGMTLSDWRRDRPVPRLQVVGEAY